MKDSIISGLEEYFRKCPLLKDGVFRVDALESEPIEYVIETEMTNPILTSYVDGSSLRQYQFSFGSREYYSLDRAQNIDNSTFYEQFCDWVEAQNKAGIFPELPKGCEPQQLNVITPGYLFDASMETARYQVQLQLIYFKEA